MNDNLIFLTEADLDLPIYRIFSFPRLVEIFNENKMTLVKPKKWDDPFENFILNSTGILPDGREYQIDFREHFFGQCWTLSRENDAMWRIYSHDKDGVKVKTTIRKLFLPLFELGRHYRKINGNDYNLSSFIGKVKYDKTQSLIAMLEDAERMSNKIFDQTGWGQASTFFFKRLAFRHEKEIRIIYNCHTNRQDDIFKFDIDPIDLFDEIVFDPRMKEEVYKEQKDLLISLGYNKKVFQSKLYKLKKFTIALHMPY